MTVVGTVLNLREKMKIYPKYDVLDKPQIWLFHDVVWPTTAKKWTKVKTHVQSVQSYCFCLLNMQIRDVLVAVAIFLYHAIV